MLVRANCETSPQFFYTGILANVPILAEEQPEAYEQVQVVVLPPDDPFVKEGLERLRESNVEVPRDIIVHLPDKMHDHGYAVRWRALADSLGFSSSDIQTLVNPKDSETQCLLTIMWNWVERKPATFGQLAQALCDIQCSDVAYNLLIPALKAVTGKTACCLVPLSGVYTMGPHFTGTSKK